MMIHPIGSSVNSANTQYPKASYTFAPVIIRNAGKKNVGRKSAH